MRAEHLTSKSIPVTEHVATMLHGVIVTSFILSPGDRCSEHADAMRHSLVTKLLSVGVRDECHWEWIVLQGSTPLIHCSYLYVSQHSAWRLFREGQWPYLGQDLLREAAFSYLHALGVHAHWYATLTLSSCQDASNYASRWSEAERGFLYDENRSMGNAIPLLFPL